jgi:peptide deformylase
VTLLKIAQIGHPVLRRRARELDRDELLAPETQRFIDDLVETMRDVNGAGLAAIQVYRPVRLVALEVNKNPRYPYKPSIPLTIVANPVIEPLSEDRFENYEGCLSVPNLRGMVERRTEVRVTGLCRDGSPFERVARGLTAGTFQHECDHLDGVLFVDRVKDPRTLSTWTEFERYHLAGFMEKVAQLEERLSGATPAPPPADRLRA